MTSNNYVNFGRKNKEKDRRFLKYKIILAVAIFLILLGGIFYAVVYSPLFHITQINADKTQISADLINNLKDFFANRSKISKFLGPDNILIWNDGELNQFLQNPEVAEIALKKDYFKRTIEIKVGLRERFGVWCQQQLITGNQQLITNSASAGQQATGDTATSCWWFDKKGVLFAVAPDLEGNAINEVDDFSGRNLNEGDSVLEPDFAQNLIKIFGVLGKSGLGIRALKLENLNELEIFFDQPQTLLPKIYFSLKEDPEFALAAVENLKSIGLNKIEYIDFRVENKVYYKLK